MGMYPQMGSQMIGIAAPKPQNIVGMAAPNVGAGLVANPATQPVQMPTAQPAPIAQYAQGLQRPAAQAQAVPPTGLIGSEQALATGFQGAGTAMSQGNAQAMGLLSNVANQSYSSVSQPQADIANQTIQPFVAGGQNAATLQANLTGANGLEAQQQAYAEYQSSPAMKYQMDQMQRATERSAAARGGLMGGNVMQALQQNAAGIASQDYQNQFANLGTVANQGLNAAGQKYGSQMNMLGQIQQQKVNAMSELANTATNHGLNVAGLYTGTAQQVAQGRMQTGQNMATNITNSTNAISNLLTQQGVAVSDMMSQDINNISSMIHSSGLADQFDNNQLASLLAQINSGQAVTAVNQNNAIGAANAYGTVGMGNAVSGGLTQGLAMGAFGNTPQPTSGTINTGSNFRGYV